MKRTVNWEFQVLLKFTEYLGFSYNKKKFFWGHFPSFSPGTLFVYIIVFILAHAIDKSINKNNPRGAYS